MIMASKLNPNSDIFSLKQLESGVAYLKVYDGGSKYSDLIKSITGNYNKTKISIPGNQMFVVYETSNISKQNFKASILINGDF